MVTVQADPAEMMSPLHVQVNVPSSNSRIKVAVREFTIPREREWKPLPAALENLFSNPYEYVPAPLNNDPVFQDTLLPDAEGRAEFTFHPNPDAEGRPDGDLCYQITASMETEGNALRLLQPNSLSSPPGLSAFSSRENGCLPNPGVFSKEPSLLPMLTETEYPERRGI